MIGIENLKFKGKVNIVLTDEQGNLKQEQTIDNLVVTAGLGFIGSRMIGTAANVMSHMEVGTGATAAAAGNTALVTALGTRQTVTATTPTTTTVQYVATFGAGVSTGAITEAGIFNASTAGTMLCRTVFSAINKSALDSMTITWTITLAAV